jgi:hypothetical protein
MICLLESMNYSGCLYWYTAGKFAGRGREASILSSSRVVPYFLPSTLFVFCSSVSLTKSLLPVPPVRLAVEIELVSVCSKVSIHRRGRYGEYGRDSPCVLLTWLLYASSRSDWMMLYLFFRTALRPASCMMAAMMAPLRGSFRTIRLSRSTSGARDMRLAMVVKISRLSSIPQVGELNLPV